MVATRRLNQLATETLALLDLPEGDLVVALSGGADSAALAWLLGQAGRTTRALHVDHGLAGSPVVRAAATAIAERLGLQLEVIEVEVAPGASPEAMARSARYGAFAESRREGETVVTAHTADDSLETVLINLVRGTGTRGLAGIPRVGMAGVRRPLLDVSRDAVREIAVLAGLPFVDDPMNADPSLARNHIRSLVLPALAALNPDIAATVTRSAALVRADADLLDALTEDVTVREADGAVIVAVGDLRARAEPVRARVVRAMIERAGGAVTLAAVERATDVAFSEAAGAELGGGVTASRRGPFLVIGVPPAGADLTVPLGPGVTRHAGFVYEVVLHPGVCQVAPLGRWAAVFATEAELAVAPDGTVMADGEPAWIPGGRRLPVAWYVPGSVGYLSVLAREESGWTSSP